jgi:hypothetical protein
VDGSGVTVMDEPDEVLAPYTLSPLYVPERMYMPPGSWLLVVVPLPLANSIAARPVWPGIVLVETSATEPVGVPPAAVTAVVTVTGEP